MATKARDKASDVNWTFLYPGAKVTHSHGSGQAGTLETTCGFPVWKSSEPGQAHTNRCAWCLRGETFPAVAA